ncbi:hypothetical protein Ahy_A05g022528 [Arachis hypogaea]|uniref:Transposase MuDR plant domain-containing protein n=1 Tax=Arachis hypogaea TaxID=3818 RepID=A0A445D0V0_ARAHY|nr:hypothetical protein Ahy_A05g022528 [Arachis hypogaea]
MDDKVMLKVYYHDLKDVICEKINSQISRRVSCILYRYPISVFGGFVQFQTKYVTDKTSMQEIFSMYLESRSRISFIELYIEFKQSAADRDILLEDYNNDSEEEFESNYEVVDSGEDKDQADDAMAADVADVANALANQQPFEESTSMQSLNLEAMHASKFPQYINPAELPSLTDGEFTMEMEFSSREIVIKAMKDYIIRRGVDYRVHESELTTFYAKCTQYGAGCDWLIRVSKISKKYYWEIKKYNGSHIYTKATISQNHSKLDSNTVAEAISGTVALQITECVGFQKESRLNQCDQLHMPPKQIVHIMQVKEDYTPHNNMANRRLPGIGARNGRRIQARVSKSVSRPSISLQLTRVTLHNALYRCARHVDPQLNCMIPAKLRSNGRNFQCTSAPNLSPNITVPNNNIM